jgi:hypothetical protein
MSAFCGTVDSDGLIISNGNFACQYDSGKQKYTISYNGNVNSGAAVVISLIQEDPGISYTLDAYSNGFKLQVYREASGAYTAIACKFNFIVMEL